MKKKLYLIIIGLIFSNCTKKETSIIFIGNINNKVNGQIELDKIGDEVYGKFKNLDNDKIINLKGTFLENEIVLNEYHENNKISGIFVGKLENGLFQGNWLNPKKTIKTPFIFRQKGVPITRKEKDTNKSILVLDDVLKFQSFKEIAKKFGKKNVKNIKGTYDEGMGDFEYTLIYPGTVNEVRVDYEDGANLIKPDRVILETTSKSIWKTKEGLTCGMTTKDLERLNQKKFNIQYSYIWGEGYFLISKIDWKNGKLSKIKSHIKLSQNISFPDPYMNENIRHKNWRYNSQSKEFKNSKINFISIVNHN